MSSELKTGYIYLFKYRAYKQDPMPLVLVLWPGALANFNAAKPAQLVHGINLNYLKAGMLADVFRLISKIATKQLSGRNTYTLYHEYIKSNLSTVVRNAYRTYDLSKATGFKVISKGFHESLSFINKLKPKDFKEQEVEKLVAKKVQVAKQVKTILGNQAVTITPEEAERRARLYLQEISKVKIPDEIDISKFTLLNKGFRKNG